MIFLSTDEVSQEAKNYPLNTPAHKSQSLLSTKEQTDPKKVAIKTQVLLLPDAQWHRSKTAKFSQY